MGLTTERLQAVKAACREKQELFTEARLLEAFEKIKTSVLAKVDEDLTELQREILNNFRTNQFLKQTKQHLEEAQRMASLLLTLESSPDKTPETNADILYFQEKMDNLLTQSFAATDGFRLKFNRGEHIQVNYNASSSSLFANNSTYQTTLATVLKKSIVIEALVGHQVHNLLPGGLFF